MADGRGDAGVIGWEMTGGGMMGMDGMMDDGMMGMDGMMGGGMIGMEGKTAISVWGIFSEKKHGIDLLSSKHGSY